MKLLIIDDEKLTREGLVSSIEWTSLGIREIFLEEDGFKGLESAKLHKPDIVLSDIRMPRMDGITMAERLREIIPDYRIIFMSGYSDKSYLKAAIKLKAINYIEKPLDPKEVEDAVMEAILKIQQARKHKHNQALLTSENSIKLALLLTYPDKKEDLYHSELIRELPYQITGHTYFTTLIIKFTKTADISMVEDVYYRLNDYLNHFEMKNIYIIKHENHVIYHVFGNKKPSMDTLHKIAMFLKKQYEPNNTFFIAIGDTVKNINLVYQSYSSAVVLIQSSFFTERNSILARVPETFPFTIFSDPSAVWLDALESKNEETASKIIYQLYDELQKSTVILPGQAKDIYYKLFINLQQAYSKKMIAPNKKFHKFESLLTYLESFQTLSDMHEAIIKETRQYFLTLKDTLPENSTIYKIKQFINKNYGSNTLSVKTISEHVFLSTTYVCTIFKAETGQTLNQYLTEFRIEKAKSLLSDPRFKITDISSKVGYTDGNYFGKTFKKYVGLSPSEYRDKMIS